MYTKIAAIRHEMRISQQELANLSNVSQSQISKMEKGTIVNPAYDKLMRIAEALGRSIDELVDRPDLSDVTTSFRAYNQPSSAAVFIPLHSERQPIEHSQPYTGGILLRGEPQMQIRKPSFLEYTADAYAVKVPGDNMQPRYFAGDTLFVDPTAELHVGDDVVVIISFGSDLVGIFWECEEITETAITVSQLKDAKKIIFSIQDLYGLHVVVGSVRGRL